MPPAQSGRVGSRSKLERASLRRLSATPGIVVGAGSGRSGSGPVDRVRQKGVNTLKGVPAFDRIAEGWNRREALKLSTATPRLVRAVRICPSRAFAAGSKLSFQ